MYSQSRGLKEIQSAGLKVSVEFLASDAFQGRKTGELSNEIAARYLASEASRLGLKTLDDKGGFLQKFVLNKSTLQSDSSWIAVNYAGKLQAPLNKGLVVFPLPTKEVNL